ncbi:MAG: hypothetical protein IAF38_12790 [Bacteroidia bacterium]|nr:hypothetical protein [Bacteroidia bacterium]
MQSPFSIKVDGEISLSDLRKGVFISVIDANKIPPHIGICINGNFSSLTIKGHELNVGAGVLLKNCSLRRIPALFIKIKDHPVFSYNYLDELLQSCIAEHKRVDVNGPTCLTPVKQFFKEGFHVDVNEIDFLFQLLPQLQKNELIVSCYSANITNETANGNYTLPVYTKNQIDERIEKVRLEYKN